MTVCMYGGSLSHHGVLGMHWGVRRYQNKDGSLTPAGKKKAAKMRDQYTELTGKKLGQNSKSLGKTSGSSGSSDKSKDLSEQTAELRKQKEYLQAKKDVLDLQRQVSSLTPQKVSKGKQFMEKYGSTIASRLWNDVGKGQINRFLEKKLGTEKVVSESERLAQRARDAENRWKVVQNEDRIARAQSQRNQNGSNSSGNDSRPNAASNTSNNSNQSSSNQNSSSANTRTNQSQNSNSNNTQSGHNTGTSQTANTSGNHTTGTTSNSSHTETFTGTVEGRGTSRYTPPHGPTIDASVRNASATSVSQSDVDRGRSQASNYSSMSVNALSENRRN